MIVQDWQSLVVTFQEMSGSMGPTLNPGIAINIKMKIFDIQQIQKKASLEPPLSE